jgi:hypothetical protein
MPIMKMADRIFGTMLILASCGHAAGTILAYPAMSPIFVWSLGSSLAGVLLGILNLLRAGRPWDRPLAAITVLGSFAWIFVAIGFGVSINKVLDSRVMGHAVIAAALVIFGVKTLWRCVRDDSPEFREAASSTGD